MSELGIEKQVHISAQSGRQVGLLLDKISESNLFHETNNRFENFINFSIVGMPNVGKSSLMNYILNENKSIVTDIAGTTRDSVDSFIKFYKKNFRIIDTAGLRKTKNKSLTFQQKKLNTKQV